MNIHCFLHLLLILIISCKSSSDTEISVPELRLSSNNVSSIFPIEQYDNGDLGCNGKGFSPHLQWDNIPTNTKSFAVQMIDLDYRDKDNFPSGFVHWSIVNIPVARRYLQEGADINNIPKGSLITVNSLGRYAYTGVCLPDKNVHRYEITLYALKVDTLANVNINSSYKDIQSAMYGNVLSTSKMVVSALGGK